MEREFYWSVSVRCARCGNLGIVAQPGEVPGGWIGIIINERLLAMAKTPNQAVKEEARYELRPHPVCSADCGAKLLTVKALEATRTKAEKITLVGQLKEILDGDGDVRSKPN